VLIETVQPTTLDPRRWYTLGALALATFMAIMGISMINVALPVLGTSFRAPFADLQWVSASYTLVAASFSVLAVRIGDIYGRKRVFLIGVAAFALGSLLCALAGSIGIVIAGRAVMGLGSAIIVPVSLAIISVTFVGSELSLAIGIYGSISIGLVIGPVLGGWLVQSFNWQAVFWLNVGAGAIALLGVIVFAQESREEGTERHIDVPGALCSIGMFFFLVLALVQGQSWGWTSGRTLGSFAASLVFLPLFIAVELRTVRRGHEPLMDLTPFRIVAFDVALMATVVVNACFAGFLFLFAVLLEGPLGYDALSAGLRYMPLMVGFVLIAPVLSAHEARLGPRLLYTAGFGAFAVGTLLLTRLTPGDDWAVLIPGLLIAGIGCAVIQLESVLGAVAAVPARLSTMASGASAVLRQVGSSIGVAVFGSILTNHYGAALPGALHGAGVPAPLSGSLLRGAAANVNAAGRLLPGLPAGAADLVRHATHTAFVGAFNDTARVVAVVLVVMLLVALPFGRKARESVTMEGATAADDYLTVAPMDKGLAG
jgi:EmrB/QacA subfamily drug resistance transporter